MAIRMVNLKRNPKTGAWQSRKVIPEDVRKAYGKANEVKRWPSSLSQAEAKAEYRPWIESIESRIELLRQSRAAEPLRLSHRQVLMLAGRWYAEQVKLYEDNPGDPVGWDVMLDEMIPDNAHEIAEHEVDTIRWKPLPSVVADIDKLLCEEGLNLHPESLEAVHQEALSLFRNLAELMVRRARGDYGPDQVLQQIPPWQKLQPVDAGSGLPAKPATVGVTITELFDGYRTDGDVPPAPSTVKAVRRRVAQLIAFLGHDDAAMVTVDDVLRWKDDVTSDGSVALKTFKDGYVGNLKSIYNWAIANRKVTRNPFAEAVIRARNAVKTRSSDLTDDEAICILRGTMMTPPSRLSTGHARARRWVPWICAYTGARVGEITQLRREDFVEMDGVSVIRITPEAGSVKTKEVRHVPIHSHLIEQGLLRLVDDLPQGPIFYDPAMVRNGSEENPQSKKVGERLSAWVRELGVTDPAVKPNHGWRHRLKTEGRNVHIPKDVLDAIQGHAPANVGGGYGRWKMPILKEWIEKLPRYHID